MPRDFFNPTPEKQRVVLVNGATLHEAERLIESCEHWNPKGAEIPFDNILDRITGSDPSVTDLGTKVLSTRHFDQLFRGDACAAKHGFSISVEFFHSKLRRHVRRSLSGCRHVRCCEEN